MASKEKQREWVQQELEGVRDLWSKKLVQFQRVTSLEREQARLDGERGQLIASVAQSKGKIAETRIQILQIDQDMRTEVGKDLADIRGKTAERPKRVAAETSSARRHPAPQDGMVHQLDVHTVGGAGRPADHADRARRRQADRGSQGAAAGHRPGAPRAGRRDAFSNFNTRTTPEVNGEITLVSADVAGSAHRSQLLHGAQRREELARWKGQLIPGMPVEVYIQTTIRTVASTSCVRSRIRSPAFAKMKPTMLMARSWTRDEVFAARRLRMM